MPAAGHGPAPLGLQVIGFLSWSRAMPCQRGRLTAFFNKLLDVDRVHPRDSAGLANQVASKVASQVADQVVATRPR